MGRRHHESTGAAASGTALSGEGGGQQRLPGSTRLRAGDERVATKQPGGSRGATAAATGLTPQEQLPPLPLPRETTEYITTRRGKEGATNSLILVDGREA